MVKPYYSLPVEQILTEFKSRLSGLTEVEAEARLQEYGQNVLPVTKTTGLLQIFFSQFLSPLILLLILAGLVIFFIGETIDAVIIGAVLLFNAIVGTFQEGKAQNTLLALKRFVTTQATVWRDGQVSIVIDQKIVPGDIISLAEGDKVPADARLISASSFKVDEASFTGESIPLNKQPETLFRKDLPPQGQSNIVFKGTHVVGGQAVAVVVATGVKTEIGQISQAISQIDTEIPLKAHIRSLSRLIIISVGVISVMLVGAGIFFGHTWAEMLSLAVSLSVSVIPEGLPIVTTLVLAGGAWRMAKRQVLIKKLQAVEALGQAQIIAVDKTGTLTKNELVVEQVYAGGQYFKITGDGYNPSGEVLIAEKSVNPPDQPALILIAKIASFGSSVRALYDEEEKIWRVAGDPTEAALDAFAKKIGFQETDQTAPLVFNLPFDYLSKYHVTVRRSREKHFFSLTGAPEVVLEKCSKIYHNGRSRKLTDQDRQELTTIFLSLSSSGLRVIAGAANENVDAAAKYQELPELTFVGFLGIKDALRAGVKETVRQVAEAGMRVIMITGDHPATALAIAREAGIASQERAVLTGTDLDKLPDQELIQRFANTTVFARVTPGHKLRIIELFRSRGEVVAMTGDGVNDAPSLAAADLGVAMGKIGTEVAKESSDLILLDDDFSNIVKAAEEGRNIYQTIKKVILYLFSTSIGEVLIIGSAVLADWPLPLLPAQIIWLNFVTDGFLDISLAMEKKEPGLLKKKFQRPAKYILDKLAWHRLLVMSPLMAAGSLLLFYLYWQLEPAKALTVSLTVMAAFQWFNAWNCKNEKTSVFSKNFFQNRWLIGATLLVIALHLVAVYQPFFQKFLRTVPLNGYDWLIILAVASTIIWAEELRKLAWRRRQLAE